MSLVENATTIAVTENFSSPYHVLLYFFSAFMVVSVLCYIFVFYYLLSTPTIRRTLNNHVVILLFIVNFIQTLFDTPLHLDYFRRGYFWPPNMTYCFILYMLDYILYEIAALLMVWASIERHISIFHSSFFNTRFRRIIGHCIPLIYCFAYPIIYYTYFILFYPCDSYYDMNTLNCVAACFLWTNSIMAIYELFFNGFIPVCLVAIFSVALLLRVLWKKQQMARQVNWRKNRKMAAQLLGIASTFLVFNIGYFVLALGQMVWDPTFGVNLMPWFLAVNVCAPQLILPFLCLGIVPNCGRKLKALNPWRRGAAVGPLNHMALTAQLRSNNTRRMNATTRINRPQ